MRYPTRSKRRRRRGAILVLSAFMLVVLIGMVAFAVDIGYITLTRTQLQVAADASALAGAGTAIEGTAVAEAEAIKYATMHTVSGQMIDGDQVDIQFGAWDSASRTFAPSATDHSAIEVTVRGDERPFFFGKILGADGFQCEAKAVATYAPRDIMLTLDFSGSMCFDSQLRSINALGRGQVEANLLEIYRQLGSPTYGRMQWNPVYIGSNNTRSIKRSLGLTRVAYPYPSGSWNGYINYVRNDSYIARAGYRKKYGYLTWVNYLQAEQEAYSQTPDLWKVSEQPIAAVKDAVDLLAAYLEEKSPDDRLGLSLYTASDGTAVLESPMIHEFDQVTDIVRHRQAGHYQPYTNIYDGMKTARLEFQNHARAAARRMMVLMTDGQANRPGSSSTARRMALAEARECADAGIPIVTISLGSGADTALMQEIADITGGVYFEIPGGQTVAQYEEDLKEVFRQVASERSLVLVQ